MDVNKVGDHECINCGECISVCPVKAISWKGSQLFVRGNDTTAPTATDEMKPLTSMLQPVKSPEISQETSEAEKEPSISLPCENTAKTEGEATE